MPNPEIQKTTLSTVTKAEWKFLLLVLLLGVVVRFVYLSHSAVEHFDEGVYASNILYETGGYPSLYLYAPPLFPFLVEVAQIFLQPTNLGAMFVSLLAGCGTILLVWHVGRRWFGSECGIAAATLAAFSDFHILYSRMVLTDVLFCFCLLLAVWLIWETFRKADYLFAAFAGVATGLAWATKYNGWLALAIGVSGLIAWGVTTGASVKVFKRNILLWLILTIVAATVWSPVLFGLPEPGYSAVSDNHSKYIVGFSGWWESALRQYRNHRFLDGWLSCIGLGVALLFAQCLRDIHQKTILSDFTWNGFASFFVKRLQLPFALTGIAIYIGSTSLLFLLSLFGLFLNSVTLWKSRHSIKMSETAWMRALAFWFLAAWMIGLIIGTPLYTAYPRLTLPLLVSLWLGAGLLVSQYVQTFSKISSNEQTKQSLTMNSLASICTVVILVIAFPQLLEMRTPAWQKRTGLEQIAQKTIVQLQQEAKQQGFKPQEVILYVYAEPALFYHIKKEMLNTYPAGNIKQISFDLKRPEIPVFVIYGPHAKQSPQFQQEWEKEKIRFEMVQMHNYRPSDIVLLNQHDPVSITKKEEGIVEKVSLYQLKY